MDSPSSNSPSPDFADPRPIAWGDGEQGVVLLHGLTGTPYEIRPIAEALHARGYAVRAPLLAGHTDLGALESCTWRDWYDSAVAAVEELRDEGRRKIVVVGFSLGGLLALRLAALRSADMVGLVAASTPLRFEGWKRGAIQTLARLRTRPVLRQLVGLLPKHRGVDVRIAREIQRSPSLDSFPYPTLAEMVALQEEVIELLPHVRRPLLLLHGRFDHTAPLAGSRIIAQRVGSERVELVVLPRSFHQIALDLDRDRACAEVARFVDSVFVPATP